MGQDSAGDSAQPAPLCRDESLVSLAGPVTNLVIAIAAFLGIAILFFAERLAHASVNPPLC